MELSASMVSRAKGALIGALSLLLLATPVCGVFCTAQVCEAPKTAEKSPCHELVGTTANELAGLSLRSDGNCALQELPVALPANFRTSSSDLLSSVSTMSLVAPSEFSFTAGQLLLDCSPDFRDSRRSRALLDVSLSSPVPLRI
jgi:hypothetical protein